MIGNYRTALVTGATGGVGQVLVERLGAGGLEVHAIGRDTEALQALARRTGVIGHAVDLVDLQALEALVAGLEIDVLIHNAGHAAGGSVTSNSAEEIDAQIDVNIRAVLQLTRLVMPGMMARNRGHILMLGSIAGHHSFDGNATYHATKAALSMLARQLRIDLLGRAVRVTEIVPGRIRTNMFARSLGLSEAEAEARFFEDYDPLLPEDIADAVDYALGVPSRVNVACIEILPTMQATGGMRMVKSERTERGSP